MRSNILRILLLVEVLSNTIVASTETAAQFAAVGVRAPDDPNVYGFLPAFPFFHFIEQ